MKRILARILEIKEEEIQSYVYDGQYAPEWLVWQKTPMIKHYVSLEQIFDYIDNKLIP